MTFDDIEKLAQALRIAFKGIRRISPERRQELDAILVSASDDALEQLAGGRIRHASRRAKEILAARIIRRKQNRLTIQVAEYQTAVRLHRDVWVAANGGQEMPSTNRNGRKALYVYNPALGAHGWLDCQTDIIYTNEDLSEVI